MATPVGNIPVPAPEAVGDLFGDLLSKGCQVEPAAAPLPLAPDVPAVVAAYVDADGRTAGAAIADLPFACRSGSALVMMPTSTAEEAVASGDIDGDMLDCFKEVANVLARLLNSPDTPHVKLAGLYRAGELLPGPVRTLLRTSDRRRDLTVTIEEYGDGRLTVVSRPEASALAA